MMPKNKKGENIKKEVIVNAALELFFEFGYESTSIRMIQKKVNSSVGLFYRYYKSKDHVFEEAIKLFFRKYEVEMQSIVDEGKVNPNYTLSRYFDYLDAATQDFRGKYLAKLHWSILGAIREYTLRIMKVYVYKILEIYLESGIINYPIEKLDVMSNLVAYAVGGCILYQDKQLYHEQKEDVYAFVSTIINNNKF